MRSVTALKMLQDGVGVGRLSFGCELIDKCTRGGLPLQGINEIVGEAGVGKTQCALTLSLQCHLEKSMSGLGGSTAYISCGEGTFPVRRLEQLSHSFEKRSGISYREFMDSVHIEQCHNADDVLETLLKRIPNMCSEKDLRLIVIDSIAGMVRTEYDSSSSQDMALRTSLLFRVAKELKWLSDVHKICVVVINQVTASGFQAYEGQGLNNEWGTDSSNPALGLAWTHCVNTRIQLRRDSSSIRSVGQEDLDEIEKFEEKNANMVVNCDDNSANIQPLNDVNKVPQKSCRLLTVELSPCNQKSSCRYEISNDGVFGLH